MDINYADLKFIMLFEQRCVLSQQKKYYTLFKRKILYHCRTFWVINIIFPLCCHFMLIQLFIGKNTKLQILLFKMNHSTWHHIFYVINYWLSACLCISLTLSSLLNLFIKLKASLRFISQKCQKEEDYLAFPELYVGSMFWLYLHFRDT